MTQYYRYAQIEGGEEQWKPIPEDNLTEFLTAKKPMFLTVLAVDRLIDGALDRETQVTVKYNGPMYFDWDAEDITDTIAPVHRFCDALEALEVDMSGLRFYATGGKGFHCEIPTSAFLDKTSLKAEGLPLLPNIYKEMAQQLATDTMDMRVYSTRRGRMWRQPNVLRPNGKYKVPLSYAELRGITPELYAEYVSAPRPTPASWVFARYNMGLNLEWAKAKQKVTEKVSDRKKSKSDIKLDPKSPTVEMMCEGAGFKPGTGFNVIALQMAIIAHDLGWKEDEFIIKCQGLISKHQGDSNRYGSEQARSRHLRDMYRYTEDNVCYETSIGAIKTILAHSAPDLQGIPSTKADIVKLIEAPDDVDEPVTDEYSDNPLNLTRTGMYVTTENGAKKVSAVGFEDVSVLLNVQDNTILGVEATVTVNGSSVDHVNLTIKELNNSKGLNDLTAKYGHAFQGAETHAKGLYMRVIEQGKKAGRFSYVTNKEGIDYLTILKHPDPELREPFLVWADNKQVIVEPRMQGKDINVRFQGFPEPQGVFRTDLTAAPSLKQVMDEPQAKADLKMTIRALLNRNQLEYTAKTLGWMVACFYKQLFQAKYGKFPLLHINGPAGSGKSEGLKTLMSFFSYKRELPMYSPGSSTFAIGQYAAGSSSIPVVVDEYKPTDMKDGQHNALKALFREAYNNKTISRGGGNQSSDDYRSLHETTLSAPICFIAEAMESEAAVMERVVLASVTPAPLSIHAKCLAAHRLTVEYEHCFAWLGKHIAASIVNEYSVEKLALEFDPLFDQTKKKFVFNEDLEAGKSVKERNAYNYTVAEFGIMKFRELVEALFPNEFEQLAEMQEQVYVRITDLNTATEPEWLKVFQTWSDMSHIKDESMAMVERMDYAYIVHGGEDAIEINLKAAYMKYRMYMRANGYKPLFPGAEALVHNLKGNPCSMGEEVATVLSAPGNMVHVFKVRELARLNFKGLKKR